MKKFLPKKNFTRTLLVGLVFLFLGLSGSFGQGSGTELNFDFRETNPNCTSNNYTFTNVYMADINGDPISTCTGGSQTVYLWAEYSSNSSSTVYVYSLFTDLVITPQGETESEVIPIYQCLGKVDSYTTGINRFDLQYSFTWNCGDQVILSNAIVAWNTSDKGGKLNCDNVTINDFSNSQCDGLGSITVNAPLTIGLDAYQVCNTTYEVEVQTTTTGGKIYEDGTLNELPAPYNYTINYGDGTIITTGFVSSGYVFPSHTYNTNGEYTITLTVMDGDGASENTTFDVGPFAEPLTLSATPSNADCNEATTGSIILSVSGGTESYSYLWTTTNGNIPGDQTNVQNPIGLSAGNYTVVVTDANGCTESTSATVETSDENPPAITAPDIINVNGCDENDISETNARYPLRLLQSEDIKDTYITTGYTASDSDGSIISITYIDEITETNECGVVVKRTFTATDGCEQSSTAVLMITVEDTEAPTLVGQVPAGATNQNLCFSDIPAGPSASEIAALFTDNCGNVNVVKSGTPTGDDCTWSVTYSYVITDDCSNAAETIEITYSGGDTEAPTLVGQVPAGATNQNLCFSDIPAGPSASEIAALFTDNCGNVNVVKSGTPTGDDCTWSVTYSYVITDDCSNAAETIEITYSGGDTEAPTLVGQVPAGATNQNLCFSDIPAGPSASEIAALFTDNCGNVNVVKSGTPTGDNCTWSVTYSYVITDDCSNAAETIEITYSGGDTEAPTLVGQVPAGATNQNLCFSDIPAGPSASEIAALFTDNCGNVNVVKSGTPTGDNCTWSVTYSYVITDDCSNAAETIEITYSGGDTEAPTLVGQVPAGATNQNLCFSDIPAGPSASEIAALFTDNCGNVNVVKSGTPTGDNCTWSVTYSYVITDDCSNAAETIEITYSGGDTEAPTLVGQVPAGATNQNLCFSDIPAGPSASEIAALFTDNCGNVNVVKSGTPTGDDCTWSVTYSYVITDDCSNAAETIEITYSGGDTEAPTLVGQVPAGATNQNLCFSDIPAGPSASEIAALFTDNCGNVNVVKSGTPTGDNCTWSVTYSYVITDDCSNAAETIEITYSGGDTEAPTLVGQVPAGATNQNLCFSDIPAGPSASEIAALFTDNCGNVNVVKSGTPTGDNCTWSVTYSYVITDDCSNAAETIEITYSGGDTEAPTLVGQVPAGATNQNLCFSDIPAGPSASEIAALFTDNCGNVNVVKSGTPTGDNCTWSVTYSYVITDDCSNAAETIEITYSGGDTEAPTLVGQVPAGATNQNLCFSDIPAGPSASEIAALFTDNCGNVNVVKSGTPTGDDCTWSVTYSYVITDDCSNAAETIEITYSGGDTEAPTLVGQVPAGATNQNLCFSDIPAGPSASEIAALFTDNCGNVNVVKSGTPTGDDCTWSVTYSYVITDDCSNAAETIEITYSGGDTEAPTLVGQVPAGATNQNLCFSDIPAGPSASEIAALFTDNCGNVNVVKSGTPTGDNCTWSVTYSYVITDDCSNAAETIEITYSGGDTEAPTLVGQVPAGATNQNLCFSDIPAGPSASEIAALFTDNCGNVNVVKSGTPTGDDCTWSVTYSYVITDDCSNATETIEITYSGGDTEAPTLVGQVPAGATNQNLCFSDIPAGPSASEIAALFTDNCGNVNVVKSGTPTGDDCTWSVTYSYVITDDCSNATETIEITYSGGDTEAPTLVGQVPAGATNQNLCFSDIPAGPSASEIAALFTDNCGNVNVVKSGTPTGDDCTWSVTYSYVITDDCSNAAETIEITYSGGDTEAPTLVGQVPAGATNQNLCFSDIPAGPSASEIAALFTDNCGNVNVVKSGTPTGDDCTWSVTYSYVITDDCSNAAETIEITYSGGDTEAPTLVGQVPAGATNQNLCFSDIPAGPSASEIAALFTDNCGNVNVVKSGTPTGDDCTWSVTYSYVITDDCSNAAETIEITYSGGDTEAPTLVGQVPAGATNQNLCFSDIPAGPSASEIAALFTDNCGNVNVVKSGTPTGDDCTWSVTYSYVITDDCSNAAETIEITYSGGDTEAPTLVGQVPAGATNQNLCFSDIPAGPSASEIAALFTDNCGNVNVVKSGTPTGDDCTWSVTYSYVITDDCSNAAETIEITYSGGDTEAPTLVGQVPAGATNQNLCFSDIPAGPSASEIAALFTDNCGNVNVVKSGTPTGDDCTWSVTYSYVITDDCSNAAETIEITYSGGDTEAPTLVGQVPAGATNQNLCFSDIPAGPSASEIAALFTDNCGNVNVVKSGTPTGDDCTWSVTYSYVITDDCSNAAETIEITYSGGDTEAPTLVGQVPAGATNQNLCFSDIPAGPSASEIAALFTDNCGNVNVVKSGTPTGDDCTWSVTYSYVITDDCSNAAETIEITYSGGDTEAPTLVGQVPAGATNQNLCFSDIPAGPSASEIAALFTDNCGNVNVVKSGTPTGDDCTWSVTYSYVITDDCSNAAETIEITYSGGDTEAPTLVGQVPAGATNQNLCFSDIPAGPSASEIAALFTDNCGNVNVVKSGTPTGDDCTWSVTYSYVITDDCSNAAETIEITYSGGDTEAPTLVGQVPAGATNQNLCFSDIPAGPSASEIAALFTDNCGNVNVVKSGTPTGDDCTWSVTYSYVITDDCSNAAETIEITYSGGDTEAPTLVGQVPAGATNQNLCFSDIPAGPSASEIAALFTDNCGNVNVVKSGTPTGDDCTWSVTYSYVITDDCSNAAETIEITYSGGDTEAPTLVGQVPAGATNQNLCFSDIPAGPSASEIAALFTDNCGNVNVVKSGTPTGDDCTWSVTYSYVITDDCSNAAETIEITYSGGDTEAPIIDNANLTNINVECGIDPASKLSDWLANNAGATATDNCGVITWSNDFGQNPEVDCNGGAIKVIFTATDECGNKSTTEATYSIQDNTPPSIDVAAVDNTVKCDGTGNIEDLNAWLASNGGASASDDCSEVSWTNDFDALSDDCGTTGTVTVTFIAKDGCLNASTTTATFTIEDTTNPTIDVLAADQTVECDGNGNIEALNTWLATNGGAAASDICGGVTWSNNFASLSDDCGATGSAMVTFYATDDCGNVDSTSATFTINDTNAPSIDTEASDMTVECDGAGNTNALNTWLAANGGAAASDVCGGVTWSNNFASLSDDCGATGSAMVTFYATDDCGNVDSTSATFTINDTNAPSIDTEASDMTVECDGAGNTNALNTWLAANGGAAASDVCGGVTWSNNFASLSDDCGATGSAMVTFYATDDCGNVDSTSATFTIQDISAPTFNETLPALEITAECDAVAEAVVLNAADNCDAEVPVVFTETRTDGDCTNSYTLTRTWTATDDCGNETSFTQTVVVSDNTAPTFNEELPTAEITTECDNIVEAVVLTAADNCDTEVPVVFTETRTDGDCANSYTLTRTWTATDDCGNETSFTQTVTVSDNTAPTFNETLPTAEITAECDAVVEAVVLTASDNCDTDVPVVFTETKTDGNCANNYTLTRTWTATDDCGNETSFTQTVVVSDNTAPEVTCNDITVQLDANGAAIITVDDINGGTTDACSDIDTMFISQATFNCDNVGENEVTLTVIDECGNVSTCTATVTVEEGDADCGLQPFKANDDILSLVYCPNETISGELDLFANDEGFTPENVNFTILTDLPEGVSVTDGNLLYANENPAEAVITFTYSVCHTVNTENCSTAEVTIQLLVDTDCDGVPDIDDLDDDDDGILDIIEEENALDQTSLDSDGDGIVDRLDIDADNDGIVDNVEWQSTIAEGGEYDYIFPLGTDSNGDGWDDAYDPASNGITYEPWDMDLDGTPDYLDTNTDNEGEDDNVEGWDKFPNDSIADVSYIGSDTDKDGLDDAYDTYNTTTEEWAPGQNAIGSDAYLQDTDDDGVRDWRDAVDDRTPPEQFACGDPVIPNAFSPNQDGYNDYFKVMIYCTGTQGGNEERVLGDDFSDARIEIFNRWGNLVYEQERYGNEDYWGDVDAWWNGRSTHNMQVGSDQLPTATYYYILYFNDGNREPITGFVFLNN